MLRISVIGAGGWGTALAKLLAESGHNVRLWAFEPEIVAQIQTLHENQLYLPDIALPPTLAVTNDIAAAVQDAELVVLVPPSHVMRGVVQSLAPALSPTALVVCCSKGIEIDSGKLMSDIVQEALPQHSAEQFAFLSGPSFAREVALGHPTAVVIASNNADVAKKVQAAFRTPNFLPFAHDDVIGVELGGALKNVMAIATGLVDGLGFGNNTRAALMTRGLYEMIKLGRALGANPLTFAGLAGMGDLILTCTGALSRNRHVGVELGKGHRLEEILRNTRSVAEGVGTAKAVQTLIRRHHVSAPICTAVYEILFEEKSPRVALQELTSMVLTEEFHI